MDFTLEKRIFFWSRRPPLGDLFPTQKWILPSRNGFFLNFLKREIQMFENVSKVEWKNSLFRIDDVVFRIRKIWFWDQKTSGGLRQIVSPAPQGDKRAPKKDDFFSKFPQKSRRPYLSNKKRVIINLGICSFGVRYVLDDSCVSTIDCILASQFFLGILLKEKTSFSVQENFIQNQKNFESWSHVFWIIKYQLEIGLFVLSHVFTLQLTIQPSIFMDTGPKGRWWPCWVHACSERALPYLIMIIFITIPIQLDYHDSIRLYSTSLCSGG